MRIWDKRSSEASMEQVNSLLERDIPDVANIHVRIFHNTSELASEALKSYYREIFFHNPWHDEDLPSLVYRSKEGRVVGFLGVIPRRMSLNGRAVRVAVAHRLMVDPNSNYPLAAVRLLKKLFSGPQDLSLSDGANDLGKKFWEGIGGRISYLYCMNWIRPLRLCRYATILLGGKRGFRKIAAASRPICFLADSLAARFWRSSFRQISPDTSIEEIDSNTLCSCISEFSGRYSLRPEYDPDSMKWLLNFLQSNKPRGTLKGYAVRNKREQLIGVYLYYLNSKKIAEVMLLSARDDAEDEVLNRLLHHAWHEGAICLYGRLEPRFLKSFWDHICLIKRGSWALIHAKDPALLNIINRGDAFISALEGELWLRSPRDRL